MDWGVFISNAMLREIMLTTRIATFCRWQFKLFDANRTSRRKILNSYFTQRQMTESSVRGSPLWAKKKLLIVGWSTGPSTLFNVSIVRDLDRHEVKRFREGWYLTLRIMHIMKLPVPTIPSLDPCPYFRGGPLKKLFCAAEKNSISAFLSTSAPSPGLLSTCSHDQKYRVHNDDL